MYTVEIKNLTVVCDSNGKVISAQKFDEDFGESWDCTKYVKDSEHWLMRIEEQREQDLKDQKTNRTFDDDLGKEF